VIYLVCTLFDYDDVLQLVLHRMLEVDLLDEPAKRPDGFSLAAYIQAHHFDYPAGGEIALNVLFTPSAGQHLQETPLSANQKLTQHADGRLRLQATVADTQQLRW